MIKKKTVVKSIELKAVVGHVGSKILHDLSSVFVAKDNGVRILFPSFLPTLPSLLTSPSDSRPL
jgi:hypothetical protein